MRSQRVPKTVYTQMVKYYGYLWTYTKGVTRNSLFVDLPVPMRAEIAVAVTRPMWSRVRVSHYQTHVVTPGCVSVTTRSMWSLQGAFARRLVH